MHWIAYTIFTIMGFVTGCLFTLYRVRKAKEHIRQQLMRWNNENNI